MESEEDAKRNKKSCLIYYIQIVHIYFHFLLVIVINRARFYSQVTSTEARGRSPRVLLLDYRTEWAVYN